MEASTISNEANTNDRQPIFKIARILLDLLFLGTHSTWYYIFCCCLFQCCKKKKKRQYIEHNGQKDSRNGL